MVGTSTRFQRLLVDGADLEYEVVGSGEPFLFIHGAIVGDAFAPLLTQPALSERYQLINYHRRGYVGSSRPAGNVSIERQALDALALLDTLGIRRAHVAGHSIGGAMALALVDAAPHRVHSLALLEPGPLSSTGFAEEMAAFQPVVDMYNAGDRNGAVDAFCQAVAGPDIRRSVDAIMPAGWFEQAVDDADTVFRVELPAALEWDFTPDMARRIAQPVLSVVGADSAAIDPTIAAVHEQLLAWLPQTETWVVPNTTHALQLMNPAGVAEGLAAFLTRHPIPHRV